MIGYTWVRIQKLLRVDFFRFCIVGGLGFVINLAILTILHRLLHFPVYVSQFAGAEVALFTNFLLHHNWTYKHHTVNKSIPDLLLQFHATTWPAIVGSTLMVTTAINFFRLSSTVALIISSLITLLWNFFWSKFVVWRNVTAQELEDS